MTAAEFKNGLTFEFDDTVYQVMEFQHVKPGKGAAFVRTKIKNIMTGAVLERSFRPTEKIEKAIINRRDMEYIYQDGELFYFMDQATYEQQPLNKEQLGDTLEFIKENMVVKVLSYKENVFGVEPPNFVELKITETEPGIRGDTAQGATKSAILETGAIITVPLFINVGDIVRVDTREKAYMERV